MTLVVGDDADVLESHLLFHLNAGVDVVVVGDDGLGGESRAIIERFEREGRVRTVGAPAGRRPREERVAQLARVAATELGADWVIEGEADQFWWPRGGSFEELLSEIPRHYDEVQALVRPFPPVEEGEGPFWERLVYRLSVQTTIEDPRSPWRPVRKLVRRAGVAEADRSEPAGGTQRLRGWYPIEVLWFPVRSPEQLGRKGGAWARADYASLALGGPELERGLAEGAVHVDTRLRDALRSLRAGAELAFARPSVVENALLGAEAAALGEGEVLAARSRIDELERRLGAVEANLAVRLERKLRSLVRRGDGAR